MPQKTTAQPPQTSQPVETSPDKTPHSYSDTPAESGLTVAQIATNLEDIASTQDIISMADYLLAENGHSMVISAGGARQEEVLKTGSIYHDLPFKSREEDGHYGFFSAMRMGFRLSQILSTSKADVVHLHSQSLTWPVYIACKLSKKPLLVKVDDPLGSVKHAPISLFKKVPLITTIEKHKKQLIHLGVPEALITVVPPAYNSLIYTPQKTDVDKVDALWAEWDVPAATRVMLVPTRRLEDSAGLDKFIQALTPLQGFPFKAIISGDYSQNQVEFTELWQQVESHDLSKHVLFIGAITDPTNTYAAADMVVCPHQYTPPVCRSPLRGQAMGKPVIASDLDEHREIITHDETGWLFSVENPGKLTEILKKALADNVRLHKMGGKGAKQVPQTNSYKVICPMIFDLYQTLVPEKATRKTKKNATQ